MDLEKELRTYGERMTIIPKEHRIEAAVRESINAFCVAEQERRLTRWEFLWAQFGQIRKRWWVFQLLLIFLLWEVMPLLQGGQYMQRALGVAATLFVILIVPELWKSRTYQSMEIEASAYYSLQQIYAARMLLFGMVDIVLISLFCGMTSVIWNIGLSQLLIQFLFPMTVTACICFGVLSCRYPFGETAVIMLCSVWSAVWLMIVLDEKIYAAIAFPLWLILLGAAIVVLAFAIYRTLHCDDIPCLGAV